MKSRNDIPKLARHFSSRLLLSSFVLGSLVLLTALSAPQAAWGQASISAHGLTMTVNGDWVDGGGYRPVRVRFQPVGALANPRTLTVQVTAANPYARGVAVSTYETVVIPTGLNPVEAVVLVPQFMQVQNYGMRVFENGEELEGLRPVALNFTSGSMGTSQWWNLDELPRVMVAAQNPVTVDSSELETAIPLAQQFRQFGQMFPAPTTGGPNATNNNASNKFLLPSLYSIGNDMLPDTWLSYSSTDLFCISWVDLKSLASTYPLKFAALRVWVRSGGNVIVSGFKSDFSESPELEALFHMSAVEEPSSPPAKRPGIPENWKAPAGWEMPSTHDYGFTVQTRSATTYATPDVTEGGRDMLKAAMSGVQKSPPFLLRPLAMGRIMMVSGPIFPGDRKQWTWMLNTLGEDRWKWIERNGVARNADNADFWNFLIPGVGLAPVTGFQALITLFVIVIGPINYFVLKRRAQLHLLMITTPLFALLVTSGLFLYAFLSDGLSVRIRATSYTLVDQRLGESVCWSRLSYYAGLAPSGGLTFSDETAVLPIDPTGSSDPTFGRGTRRLNWDDQQRLASGWLPSRTPIQFFTIKPATSMMGVRVVDGSTPEALRLENQLGTNIVGGAIALADGSFRAVGAIPAGGAGDLSPLAADAVGGKIHFHMFQARGSLESTRVPTSGGRRNLFGVRRYYFNQVNISSDAGLLSDALQDAGNGMINHRPMGPRSYLLVVERSPQVEYGTPKFSEEASLHVIAGHW